MGKDEGKFASEITLMSGNYFFQNRPAMNYDKLSRSLRYYYEKGIMSKGINLIAKRD